MHIFVFIFYNHFLKFQLELTYNTTLVSGVHPSDQIPHNPPSDHPNKSHTHLTPYKATRIPLIIFSMLHSTSSQPLWKNKFVLPNLSAFYTHPLNLPPIWQLSKYFLLSMGLCLFCLFIYFVFLDLIVDRYVFITILFFIF